MTFSLKQIKKTKDPDAPVRTLVYGAHKIGKSSFAAGAKDAIFIQTEDGLDDIEAQAFPLCKSFDDLMSCIATLYNEDHKFATVVLDSADWAERLIHAKVCENHNVKGIEAIGYGKGYVYAADLFKEVLDGLNALRNEKGMSVVVLCHSEIRRFDDPQADSYDRYQIKLGKAIGKLVQEWADVIGFAQVDTITKVEKGTGFKEDRTRAITTGKRVLRLTGAPAFDAGNRYSLPDSIELIWSEYEGALKAARNPNKE